MGKPYQEGYDDGLDGKPKKDFGVAAVYLDAILGGSRNEDRKEYEKGYKDGEKKRKSKR